MDEPSTVSEASTHVEWRLIPPDTVSPPVIRQLPYLELKLEHPGLEPTGYGDRFFPDVVPYEFDDTSRIFYWRPALVPLSSDPGDWKLACATIHELTGIGEFPTTVSPLVTEDTSGTTIVVDGMIGGDVMTSHVQSYVGPDISLNYRSNMTIELLESEVEYIISTGERRRIRLAEQRIELMDQDDESTTITPELVVRYPGQRELHHPAKGASYRLFPSFGLDLDDVPNPLSVPTTAGELDDTALANELGVDLSHRPYPERVLWQALAYTAFDPHSDTMPELTQLETGHIVLQSDNFRTK